MRASLSGIRRVAFGGGLALALSLAVVDAQASGVYWSVGVQSPGVVMGWGNTPGVVVAQPPVWAYGPPPPAVLYPAQPVYRAGWAPAGGYYMARPAYPGPYGWEERGERGEREWRHHHHHPRW